ncbi:ABC transporter substrate-binding protein [Vibrio penaeicida]|uniref:ABC transporter substrate-binding protein n=1 Tax=Vibrio penaeicida TaxID=104609 RepID=UPI000CEA40A2|nr:ABC transporter substrate-binding protein [Vibrio penaeicida]
MERSNSAHLKTHVHSRYALAIQWSNRRIVLISFIVISLALITPRMAFATTVNVNYVIGFATWSGYPDSVAGFKAGLAEFGIQEGKNATFIMGKTGANKELQTKVANKIKDTRPNLVYSLTTPGTTIIKNVLPASTPIVFSIVTYPADSGLIDSFDYSGNNLVGTSNYVSNKHYVALLRKVLPETRKISIFHRKGEPNSKIQASNILRLMKKEGIKVEILAANSIEHLSELAMDQVGKTDVFMTTTDTLMQSGGEEALIAISHQHKIPILSSNKSGILKGSTFGPVADFYTLGKMAGEKAGQILVNDVPPTQLQSELQEPPLFMVNTKAINMMGISVSVDIRDQLIWVDK